MKKTSFRFLAAIITLSLSSLAATATGCGGASTSSFCEDVCACQRCTSNDLQACKDQGDKAVDEADAAGCSTQFDDFLTCASAHVSCKDDQPAFEGCEAEVMAMSKCSSGVDVLGRNPCELAADSVTDKITKCGGTVTTSSGSGDQTVCSDEQGAQATCQAACIDAADCSLLLGGADPQPTNEQVKAFTDCITTCQ
jgi:hypothetical protein